MSNKEEIEKIISFNNDFQKYLFTRGFLFTNAHIITNGYPFYGNWKVEKINEFTLISDKKINTFRYNSADEIILLIGHVYNPFDGLTDENKILEKYALSNDRISYFNQWTGLFTLIVIHKNFVEVWGDCSGMQSAYYGVVSNCFYLSSHSQMIGDLCNLPQSEYTKRIISYKYWQLYGMFLPGDNSQFENVFRLVPNTFLRYDINNRNCTISRFYPTKELKMCKSQEEYSNTIAHISDILNKNLELICKKWSNPAISMSGGMDSKTTLACANGLYDKFKYYSYDTMPGDRIDVAAAKKISEHIGIPHRVYTVSEKDSDFVNIDFVRKIMEHNWGDIGKVNPNDVRKRMYFMDTSDFDVEVKSWVSEIGRANYYKKFGLKKMPKRLSPRQMTSMYKFFSYNRNTAILTDKIFSDYIKKTCFNDIYNYDASDMYLWEFRYGAWGGLVITSEHRMSYDITIPYNNRILMEMFLTLPLEKRIEDIPHYDIIKLMNSKIDELGITITNYNETRIRMYMEKLYFKINSILPF